MPMLNIVKNTIEAYEMILDQRPIIIGVSGGPDSMALLHILSRLVPNQLVAAHLNHQFRGVEAAKDADFVRDECNKMGIPFVIKEYDVPEYMKQTKLGAQEAARKVRYEFYLEVAKSWDSGMIALGHHANDQAETVIMRILRGTGPHGLSGISYVRDFEGVRVIRPLLDVTREEIERYINESSIPYRIDQSNFQTKYFRNKTRLSILPFLQKFNPNLISHLSQLAKVNQAEDSYLKRVSMNHFNKCLIRNEQSTHIFDVSYLQGLDIALQRRVIHLILSYLYFSEEFSFSHIEKILFLVNQSHPSKSLDLPNLRVYREYGNIVFSTSKNVKETLFQHFLPTPGVIEIPQIKKRFIATIENRHIDYEGIWAVFDYHLFENKVLLIRNRKTGDRMQIKGMDGRKKVKDIFIDLKIPKEWRDRQPIIEADQHIIWMPGIQKSAQKAITENTTSFLYIRMEDF